MIVRASYIHITRLMPLVRELFPNGPEAQLKKEVLTSILREWEDTLMYLEDEHPLGFALVALRRDYVEGALHSPVGYLEAIYVLEKHRGKGIASKLLDAAEDWCPERGCLELGSDIRLEEDFSHKFHAARGFQEQSKLVTYVKSL
jgi:aminoglycoside 6'-N-acetyltransferase I